MHARNMQKRYHLKVDLIFLDFCELWKKIFKFSFLFGPSGSPNSKYWLKQKLKLKIYKINKNLKIINNWNTSTFKSYVL